MGVLLFLLVFFTTTETLVKELAESDIRSEAWNKLGFLSRSFLQVGQILTTATKSLLKPPSLRTEGDGEFNGRRRTHIDDNTGNQFTVSKSIVEEVTWHHCLG